MAWIPPGEEIELVRPKVLTCLGATAAKALLGPKFSVTASRGVRVESTLADHVLATVHPSSLLRMRAFGSTEIAEERDRFVADLRRIGELLAA